MPIRVKESISAVEKLRKENIFAMTNERAIHQDIRELNIAVLNLMPDKITTETQLLRAWSNTPIQIDIELLCMASHQSIHTSAAHLTKYYETFDKIKDQYFDGMIITGAPVECPPGLTMSTPPWKLRPEIRALRSPKPDESVYAPTAGQMKPLRLLPPPAPPKL